MLKIKEILKFVFFHPVYFVRYLILKLRMGNRLESKFPVYIGRKVHIKIKGKNNRLILGKKTRLKYEIWIELLENAILEIGANSNLTRFIIIHCGKKVKIGKDALIAEFVSIRDSQHKFNDNNIPFNRQGYSREEVIIGNNVWVGRSCIIMPGAILGNNLIVAANSVVNKSYENNLIIGGVPSKIISSI